MATTLSSCSGGGTVFAGYVDSATYGQFYFPMPALITRAAATAPTALDAVVAALTDPAAIMDAIVSIPTTDPRGGRSPILLGG